jgi:L-ascorbate metabolism protein UlaG (beta-lactamase superfamily)
MSPREAAYACTLLRPKVVIPMHFGTFPILSGRPKDLEELMGKDGPEVREMKPGETI